MTLQLTAPAPFTKHVEHDEIEMLDGTIAVVRIDVEDIDLLFSEYDGTARVYTEQSN